MSYNRQTDEGNDAGRQGGLNFHHHATNSSEFEGIDLNSDGDESQHQSRVQQILQSRPGALGEINEDDGVETRSHKVVRRTAQEDHGPSSLIDDMGNHQINQKDLHERPRSQYQTHVPDEYYGPVGGESLNQSNTIDNEQQQLLIQRQGTSIPSESNVNIGIEAPSENGHKTHGTNGASEISPDTGTLSTKFDNMTEKKKKKKEQDALRATHSVTPDVKNIKKANDAGDFLLPVPQDPMKSTLEAASDNVEVIDEGDSHNCMSSYHSDSDSPECMRQDLANYEFEDSSEGSAGMIEDDSSDDEKASANPFGLVADLVDGSKQREFTKKKTFLYKSIKSDTEENAPKKQVDEDIMETQANPLFQNYAELFKNLTNDQRVETANDIITIIITYDSSRAITVTKHDDTEYLIKQYSLKTRKIMYEKYYRGEYIKMKEVEQNQNGKFYHIPYMDNGIWKLSIFSQDPNEEYPELNINRRLDINNHTIPVAGFSDPYITSCFLDDDRIFLNFFHNVELKHYHFIYSIKQQDIISNVETKEIQCTKRNFPYKTFYNENANEIYTFYRQGQGFTIKEHDLSDFRYEQVYDADLGQMYLYNNTVLMARSSSRILFFKIEENDATGSLSWVCYYFIDVRGFIFFIKGNKRIQITTDEKIFFYTIDKESLEPKLENAMYNFMQCDQMMFGSAVRYCICYKTNQKGFTIYTRRYVHDFMVKIAYENYEGAIGLNIVSMNVFLVSNVNKIQMYDNTNFQEIKDRMLEVPLLESDSRERNEIIAMAICPYEKYLGVITGRNLIKNAQKPNQLYVFKRTQLEGSDGENVADEFNLNDEKYPKRLKENKLLDGICMDFVFKDNKISKKADTLILAQRDRIIKYNYKKNEIKLVHKFIFPLKKQPDFFRVNTEQKICMIASTEDSIYLNLHRSRRNREIDIDKEFQISAIKSVIYDKGSFYILANKTLGKLGYYLIRMDEKLPIKKNAEGIDELNGEMIINRGNKLDIGDANMYVLRNPERGYKELVVSYKQMYINTYNVNIIDLHSKLIIFRHESFQLWESKVSGFLTTYCNDFVILNKQGISIIAFGDIEQRRFKDNSGQAVMLHSLESTNYLKVEKNNHILFVDDNDKKYVMIQEQVIDSNGETQFDSVLQILLNQMTLRELLMLQSLYVCKTQSHVIDIVNTQPNPSVFYRTFLELNKSNMLNILAFDSKSINSLLKEEYRDFYNPEFPCFFTQKITKASGSVYYRNALDIALKNNQIGAISKIIWYITNFQNDSVSSFLFLRNLPQIMEKGISVCDLLDSDVFKIQFEYSEWPQTHWNYNTLIAPYNHSMFQIADKYEETFLRKIQKDSPQSFDHSKQYKIKYELNILPIVGYHISLSNKVVQEDVSLMALCIDSWDDDPDVKSMFEVKLVEDMINFKWEAFALNLHRLGCVMHMFYLVTIILYVNLVYINDQGGANTQLYSILLAIGISYPALYDTIQMFKSGNEYWSDTWNYTDFIFIWSAMLNIGQQSIQGPFAFPAKANMIVTVIMLLVKTFFFLRIFSTLSYIVTMFQQVIYDLRIFLLFYFILLYQFSLIIDVLGIGNWQFKDSIFVQNNDFEEGGYFGEEYKQVGLFFGNIVQMYRISLADYDFGGANDLHHYENIIYIVCWFIMVQLTCVIFLNFIIAEASDSYAKVMNKIDAQILKEKASMIEEAESMIPERFRTPKRFPQYIIKRSLDQ